MWVPRAVFDEQFVWFSAADAVQGSFKEGHPVRARDDAASGQSNPQSVPFAEQIPGPFASVSFWPVNSFNIFQMFIFQLAWEREADLYDGFQNNRRPIA